MRWILIWYMVEGGAVTSGSQPFVSQIGCELAAARLTQKNKDTSSIVFCADNAFSPKADTKP